MLYEVYNKKYSLLKPINNTPLDIICAGHVMPKTDYKVSRLEGTPNYLIINITSGEGVFFTFNGKRRYVGRDNIIIIKPNEPQLYEYLESHISHNYWIHFGGTAAKKIMEEFNLENTRIINMPNSPMPEITKKIMTEISNNNPFSKEISISYLYNLLATIGQHHARKSNRMEIDDIINQININYSSNTTVNEYSEQCELSVPHFLRLFKQKTGTTPVAFRLGLRIDNAKEILRTTDIPIKEVAHIVGFNDQFYFSRYFKKITGLYPTEYRNNSKTTKPLIENNFNKATE